MNDTLQTLHVYTLTEDFLLTHESKEAKKAATLYTLINETPHKRILISSIGKINSETGTLVLTSPDQEKATHLFVDHLNAQADVYSHTALLLRSKAKKLKGETA